MNDDFMRDYEEALREYAESFFELQMFPIRMYYELAGKPFGDGDKEAWLYSLFNSKTTKN